MFDPKQAGGGGGGGGRIRLQDGSFLCCAETVSSKKLKLCDFYYILIGFNSDYKPVPWTCTVVIGLQLGKLHRGAESIPQLYQILKAWPVLSKRSQFDLFMLKLCT